jgi:hypothetical protein
MAKVIRLNSKRTLSMITERINKKVEKTGGNDDDVRKLMSIVHRHMHFHLSIAK